MMRLLYFIILFFIFGGVVRAEVIFTPTEIVIETFSGDVRFAGELASSPSQLAYGLKFRRVLPDDYAMLFDLGEVRRASFWMQDTYVSLDMLFVREDGRIESILAAVPPLTLEPRSSLGAVRAVIEMRSGLAARHGIRVGDLVRHALFR